MPVIRPHNGGVCDTFVSLPEATADGSVILGKNSDREPNEAHVVVVHPRNERPDGSVRATYIEIPQARRTNAVLLAKPYWMWGAEMGVNEHGVVIGNEAVFTKAKREKRAGLLGMDQLRLALERAETADEAVDTIAALLVAHGQGGRAGHTHDMQYDNSYLISDRREAWILETVGRDWAARRVEGAGSISNRLTLGSTDRCSPGLRGEAVTERSDLVFTHFSDSAARLCRTSDALAAQRGAFDVPAARALLRDHGGGPADFTPARRVTGQTVCAHAGPGPIRGYQTTGSMVAHVTGDDITVWVTATSAPCTSVFKPVWVDVGLPDQVPPTGTYDPTALWWRHDVLHRATLRNYQRVAAYAAARDELEARFLAGAADAADRAAYTAQCFDRAEEALDTWTARALAIPAASVPPLYAWAWRRWDQKAGMP
jgi:secernin